MICPRDHILLIRRETDGYHFHFCDRCHGIWFSRSGLERIIAARDRPQIIKPGQEPWVTHDPKDRPGMCPVDGTTPMVLGIKHGIYMNICHEHKGIWLDFGELEKMIGGIRGSLDQTRSMQNFAGQILGEIFFEGAGEVFFHIAAAGIGGAAEVAAEIVPEVADAVFGTIVEIVASLFS